ncbi:MAG: hypothetical protein ACJAYU_001420 [Bradymonadia bacterium]|jgi:hypothetical protein
MLAAVPCDADAVYVAPLVELDTAAFAMLVAGLIERDLLSVAVGRRGGVTRGLLLGVYPMRTFSGSPVARR